MWCLMRLHHLGAVPARLTCRGKVVSVKGEWVALKNRRDCHIPIISVIRILILGLKLKVNVGSYRLVVDNHGSLVKAPRKHDQEPVAKVPWISCTICTFS